jgi:hypothetical protein
MVKRLALAYVALIGGALVALPALAQTSSDLPFVKDQAVDQWRRPNSSASASWAPSRRT